MSCSKRGRKIGESRLIGLLGAGGMGAVFLGMRTGVLGSTTKVAIKQILPSHEEMPGAVDRLLREARNAQMLNHPNIVGVHEVGRTVRTVDRRPGGVPEKLLEQVEPAEQGRLGAARERGERGAGARLLRQHL